MIFVRAIKSAFKGPKIKVKVSPYQKIPQQVSFLYSEMACFQRNISHRAAPSSNLGQTLTETLRQGVQIVIGVELIAAHSI